MTASLGIHISDEHISAAICAGDVDDTRAVPLGTTGLTAPAAVAAGIDGAVLVGEHAVDATGPIVRDPIARAARGRTGALTAVITHVVGRATIAGGGTAPGRLALVIPDEYVAVERDNVVNAANAAGFTDVALVPRSLAEIRGTDVVDGDPLAFGAARIGVLDAPPPLVTREDLGQVVEPEQPAPLPPAADGPVSVFDETPEPDLAPVRATPEPVAAAPPNRPVTPAAAPAAMVAPPPLQPIPERRVPLVPVVLLAVAALLGLLGFVVFAGGDDATETSETTTTLPPTTEAPTTTVAPEATTSTTTTEAPESTTSSTSSTTTSSTSTTTTTTTPVRVSFPGPVTLAETGLAFDTGVVVRFGQSEDIVLDEIAAVLGDPDSDTGSTENDFCAGSSARFVRWGNLELVFTNTADPESPRRFSQWFADGHLEPTGLVTPEGLGESATVGFLEVTFPSALVLVPAFEDDIVGIFAVTNPTTGAVLNGTTLGLDPNGVVTSLWAGDSCTRVFT